MSVAPHQRRPAAGIDLGTTNSLVAIVYNDQAETSVNREGRRPLLSAVHYRQQGYPVGYDARTNAALDTTNIVSPVEYLVGRPLADIQQRYPRLPYQFQASENGLPMTEMAMGPPSPARVSTDTLRALAARTIGALAGELDDVVITVLAYLDDAQRQGIKDATCLVGLHALCLLSELTAAAIAHGLDSGQKDMIAVYDPDGGMFDTSILRLSRDISEVPATGGDSALDGNDFDRLLTDYIREQADIPDRSDNCAQRELSDAVVAAKIALSDADSVTVNAAGWQGEISREQFNELIVPLVERALLARRHALKNVDVEADEVLEVVIVGGSTRVPLVRERVNKFFGRPLLTFIDPNKVAAIGAAIQADILVSNKPDSEMLLLGVVPPSLGLEMTGGLVEEVIPRNITIPMARAQGFITLKDGQAAMSTHVMQGECGLVQDCHSLVRFALRSIPVLPAGGARICVMFQVDTDGPLSVTATEKSTDVEASIQVRPPYGLTDSEIASMIKDLTNCTEQDTEVQMLVERKVEAVRVLEGLCGALVIDAALLSTAKRQVIDDAVAHLGEVAQGDDADVIEQATKNVDKQAQGLAARRTDQPVRYTLKGHSVDEI